MIIEMLSIFIITIFLKNKGIFFLLIVYSHIFKNKIIIKSYGLFERLWFLMLWILVLCYMETNLLDIILFSSWIIIREIFLNVS